MTPDELTALLEQVEGERLEFKRDWYDLDSKRGRAEFSKDVLAMANTLPQGQRGHIVFGVDDARRGQGVVGVEKTPTPEQVAQILGSYCRPVPDVTLEIHVGLAGSAVDVLTVRSSPNQPHYATRDVAGTLSSSVVYTRHGPTVATLTPPELENLIRAKDARLGRAETLGPLVAGFVALPDFGPGEFAVRVRNVTEEPLDGVSAILDVWLVYPRRALNRVPLLTSATLAPGEVREVVWPVSRQDFYDERGRIDVRGKIWSQWLDIRLYLRYRDRDGVLQQIVKDASVA